MDKVVHFEIPVDDWDRAKKFYTDNFGWSLMDMKGDNGELIYVLSQTADTDKDGMVQEKGAINGGLSKRGKDQMVPRVYIGVAAIEDAKKKIEASGGKFLAGPMPIPNGRMAVFIDSEGNVMGLADDKKM